MGSQKFRFFTLIGKNLANRPYRNIATVFAFAIIAATLFSSQYLTEGAQQSLDTGMSRMGADVLVVPEGYAAAGQTVILIGQPNSFFFNDSGFEKISRIPGVAKASPQIYIATLFASCCAAPVQMIAIDQANDFTLPDHHLSATCLCEFVGSQRHILLVCAGNDHLMAVMGNTGESCVALFISIQKHMRRIFKRRSSEMAALFAAAIWAAIFFPASVFM